MAIGKLYVTASELADYLDVSKGMAYKIIRQMNQELAKDGYITISGKCPRRYLEKKYYGIEEWLRDGARKGY